MHRRQALLGTSTVFAALAGCGGNVPGNDRDTSPTRRSGTETSSATSTSGHISADQATPPTEFRQEWSFDRDDDWRERRRATEYPDSDEAVDWTPAHARTAEYAHLPSQEEFASAVGAGDVPTLTCAVLSKWKLPADYSNTPVGFVDRVTEWFETQFDSCAVSEMSPRWVEPGQSELESGRNVGDAVYESKGDTGSLESPFEATVEDESVVVERVTYEAEGRLLSLLSPNKQVGYLVGGGWPASNTVTLHTADDKKAVTAKVSGESWEIEESLFAVFNPLDREEAQ